MWESGASPFAYARLALLDALHAHLADELRRRAAGKGMPIVTVADHADIARSHMFRILNGESSPTLQVLNKLAEALDCEVRDLMPE